MNVRSIGDAATTPGENDSVQGGAGRHPPRGLPGPNRNFIGSRSFLPIMDWLLKVDWAGIFEPKHALLELFLRGTIMYMVVFVLLRLVVRRQVGGIGMTDILVIVLIAEVTGNGISDNFQSVPESTVLVGTVLFWSYLIEWLQSHFPAFERLVRDPKLKLIENGRMLRKNMRSEFVTIEELMAQLREGGLEDCTKVKAAYMEADGKISIIRRDGK
jgi:uncharacterized membrane protein YcaP (DUF421 family)